MAQQREFVDEVPIDESDKIIVRGAAAAIVPTSERRDAIGLIQLAIESGYAVADLKSLAELQERQEARKAREAFNAAVAGFKRDCPVIVKTKRTGIGNAKHAPLDKIEGIVAPFLGRHGLTYNFPSCLMTDRPNTMRGICRVNHVAGHSEDTPVELPVPVDLKGVNIIQQAGIVMSYLRRYALCHALGLRIADEDTDGMGIGSDVVDRAITSVTIEQANAIEALLTQLPRERRNSFFAWASSQTKREMREVIDLPQSLVAIASDLLRKSIAAESGKVKP